MIRRPPRSTRTDTPFPTRRSSDLCRSPRRPACRTGRRVGHCASGCPRQRSSAPRTPCLGTPTRSARCWTPFPRSEEHTSELQSLMRISYAVFCLKKKKPQATNCAEHKEQLYNENIKNDDNE